jgi:hypothetical protein
MEDIFFIHFHEEGLKEKIQLLKKAGYKVCSHFSSDDAGFGCAQPAV